MKKILVNVVHPNLENDSRINKKLVEFIQNEQNVTINNLYKKYPDFKIDIKKEQDLLLENDVIIFQFPMYWFSSPALLKEYIDLVLEENFAYGRNNEDLNFKLKNKTLAVCTTLGLGEKEINVENVLKPFELTAEYIKMSYKSPFLVYETYVINNEDLRKRAKDYINFLKEL